MYEYMYITNILFDGYYFPQYFSDDNPFFVVLRDCMASWRYRGCEAITDDGVMEKIPTLLDGPMKYVLEKEV